MCWGDTSCLFPLLMIILQNREKEVFSILRLNNWHSVTKFASREWIPLEIWYYTFGHGALTVPNRIWTRFQTNGSKNRPLICTINSWLRKIFTVLCVKLACISWCCWKSVFVYPLISHQVFVSLQWSGPHHFTDILVTLSQTSQDKPCWLSVLSMLSFLKGGKFLEVCFE